MTILREIARPALIVLALIGIARTDAAVMLGFHEAQVLVQHTPLFLDAVKRGECPQISDGILNGQIATFVIRGGCKGYSLVGGLYVDVKSGIVTKDSGVPGGIEVETPELAELRKTLFAQRADERLTRPEALCLLRRVAASLHANKTCGTAIILNEEDDRFVGSVEDSEGCASPRQRGQSTFAVDRYDGTVSDLRSGEIYKKSAEVEHVRTDLLALHAPVRLTVDEAKRLAAAYPATSGSATRCTKVEVDPLYTADEVWLQVWRGCGDEVTVTRLSVNVLTGATQVIDSKATPEPSELRTLREELLNEARSRKAAAAKTVQTACVE